MLGYTYKDSFYLGKTTQKKQELKIHSAPVLFHERSSDITLAIYNTPFGINIDAFGFSGFCVFEGNQIINNFIRFIFY